MLKKSYLGTLGLLWLAILACQSPTKNKKGANITKPKGGFTVLKDNPLKDKANPPGMVWVPGGIYKQGAMATDQQAMAHERPRHAVAVDGFFMDTTEVTNAQYTQFVKATGYITVAEREIVWDDIKAQLPPGTPKPHDSVLQPGSLIFKTPKHTVTNMQDYAQWWEWKVGANWQQPYGKGSDIIGKDKEPVVHIAYEDALAYCKWIGRRLPTEAEWEHAARGGIKNSRFSWGDDASLLLQSTNSWSGNFPMANDAADGYANKAPVGAYAPNGYGLYDMVGNVWEWTTDWYHSNYYQERYMAADTLLNPTGPKKAYNAYNPWLKERVLKGGSFLCNAGYCANFRVSARMGNALDSAQEHVGFRTVVSAKDLN